MLDFQSEGKRNRFISRLSNDFQFPIINRRLQLNSPGDRSVIDFDLGSRLGLRFGLGRELSFDNFGFSGGESDILLWGFEYLGIVGIERRGWTGGGLDKRFGGEGDEWIGVDGIQDLFGLWSGHDGVYDVSDIY